MGALVLLAGTGVPAESAGHFEVRCQAGRWWFVAPDGSRFWSCGVDQADPGPATGDLSQKYAARRYYADESAWASDVLRQLRGWGFNTLGGWHDKRLRQAEWAYAEVLHLGAMDGAPWNDLFSDDFAEHMDRHAARLVAPCRDDPRVLGWFADNELAWYPDQMFAFHLRQPAASRTRTRLIELLLARYDGDFSKLTADFSPSAGVDSFADLQLGGTLKRRVGGGSQGVVDEFAEAVAERYYEVVCSAIRRQDPNHLVLGDRYHGYCPDPIVRAAGRHVDVISTNYDWPRAVDGYLPRAYLRRLHELTNKPVMITEYYAAAAENRSGNPNSGGLFVVTATQQQRAAVARRRLRFFATEPYVVGAHWFALTDEPPAGRPKDGEDYNFGLLDIENRPYQEVVAALSSEHRKADARHAQATPFAPRLPRADTSVSLSSLSDVTPENLAASLGRCRLIASQPTGGDADLLAARMEQRLYLTMVGNHYVDASIYDQSPTPQSEGLHWRTTLTCAGREKKLRLTMLGDQAQAFPASTLVEYDHRGVRFSATIAVAPSDLGLDSWPVEQQLTLASRLVDRRARRETSWNAQLKFVSDRNEQRRVSPESSVDQVHASSAAIKASP